MITPYPIIQAGAVVVVVWVFGSSPETAQLFDNVAGDQCMLRRTDWMWSARNHLQVLQCASG